MIYYFDTSALVKLFSIEAGSKQVKEIVNNGANEIWVLELALIELTSAVYRKFRNNEIREADLEKIQDAIKNQFNSFSIVPLAVDIVNETLELIERFGKDYGLRTLDAMHIAGWTLVARDDWHFVTSDKNQLTVMELMHFKTISI